MRKKAAETAAEEFCTLLAFNLLAWLKPLALPQAPSAAPAAGSSCASRPGYPLLNAFLETLQRAETRVTGYMISERSEAEEES
jgi:hypothetical protein